MPTSTNRGRCNWTCPAALCASGLPLVVAGLCVVATTVGASEKKFKMSAYCMTQEIFSNSLFTVVCVSGVGTTVGCVGTGAGTELKVGVVGTGTVLTTVGVVGGGTTTVGAGAGRVAGRVFVAGGGGSLIVVGPPTGPVQTSPSGQHPIIPLLASAQTVL